MFARALILLLGLTTSTLAYDGLRASLDISVIEQAKDVYMDTILKFLNNLQLPDLGDSKDYLHGNHVSVSQDAQYVTFTVDTANNAVVLRCEHLNAVFYSDSFRAHELFFVAKGHLDVIMNDMTIQLGLKFKT